jgi:signal transduction histidine kinase
VNARAIGRLAQVSALAALGLTLIGLVLGLAVGSLTAALDVGVIAGIAFTIGASSFAGTAFLISGRHPGNAIGWLFAGVGLAFSLALFGAAYAEAPVVLPAERWMAWLSTWAGAAVIPLISLALLLFPTGHIPSRSWRPALWTEVAATVLLLAGNAFTPGPLGGPGRPINPVGIGLFANHLLREGGLGWILTLFVLPAAGASLVLRYRGAGGAERQQLKFLALSAVVIVVGYAIQAFTYGGRYEAFGIAAVMLGIAALPIATGAAILRFRLYDIDAVISRTVVFGALAGFITVVYVGVVVGAGALLGRTEADLTLQVAATALVALAFQPVRERARRLANRLVYGERAEPYEVLARFASRAAGTYATEDVLPRTARVIGEGTGALRAEVWLRMADELRLGGSWPEEAGGGRTALPMPDGRLPELPGPTDLVPIEHRGELLGAVAVAKPPGEPLTPAEEALLRDLAKQAGLVLRNVRLTEELRARLEQIATQAEQLRASRQRIVAAHDAERRRLERNIHDGAQQHLVALAVKLRLARDLLSRDAERAAGLLQELRAEIDLALETLRDLAGGIYPAVLEERGLVAALETQARLAGVPVRVEADGLARRPIETEAAVYFACLEALQNAVKHAGAAEVRIQLAEVAGRLSFSVRDDGRGFDPAAVPGGAGLRNMADRVEALGGRLEVRSAPGRGTTVEGEVPIKVAERVP